MSSKLHPSCNFRSLLKSNIGAGSHNSRFACSMELVEAITSLDPYSPWLGHPTPQSPFDLQYSSPTVLSSEHLSVYVDKDNLHHPSMRIRTPASSTDLSDDQFDADMAGTSSHILERIQPIEASSFGSAEEMFRMRDGQSSTREYSLRQTYSFLSEISSSGSQPGSLPLDPPQNERSRIKLSQKVTPPSDGMWSPPITERSGPYVKYSKDGAILLEDARKTSLNKNKLAAARCRVNKNIQTDKLRESAHTVVAANNRLRQEVMDKMEEIQALHTEVLCHAVDIGCRHPQELRKFLCADGEYMVEADSKEPLAHSTPREETLRSLVAVNHDLPEARVSRRRSDAPSPSCGINRFKHGSIAHQRAERRLRTQLSEP